jgi:hypothetical protein
MTEQASLTEQIVRPSVEEIHASIPHKGVWDLLNDAKNTSEMLAVQGEAAADTLKSLGLDEFVEDWTLNLEKDVG